MKPQFTVQLIIFITQETTIFCPVNRTQHNNPQLSVQLTILIAQETNNLRSS